MVVTVLQLAWNRPLALAALIALPVLLVYWQRSLAHLSAQQKMVSFALRTLFILTVAAALAGPVVTWHSHETAVVAVIDVSRSVSPQSSQKIEPLLAAASQAKADFRAIKFAAANESIDVKAPLKDQLSPLAASLETNIAAALVSARTKVPADRVGKLLLFTDGNATAGDSIAAARAVGVPIDTVPLPSVAPEFAVEGIEAPRGVRAGEPYMIEVRVQATQAGEVAVDLVNQGAVVRHEKRKVSAGENRFGFPLDDKEPAVKTYTARLAALGDTNPENNTASCGVRIGPRAKVLVVDRQTALAEHLKQALVSENIDVQVRTPEGLPTTAKDLSNYELVILSNVPATLMPEAQMKALVSYVHDDGGGLIVVGGDNAFTAGGYRGTPLEEALPVISEMKKDRPQPVMAMVLVLDISGSMEGRSIDLAKQALSRAVDKLGPRDLVGVLVFEDESRWIAPLGPVKDKEAILSKIKGIKAEGGTTMYPAMERAFLALHSAAADRKHMIVMTDGVSNPGDFNGLARQINADGISVSMVGVGGEPARPLLKGIADTAHGRAYFCDDVSALPKIFEMETLAAGRPGVTEERFIPKVMHTAQVLRGIDFEQAPLLGYVATQARPEAHVILATKNDEPLLALWRYGRGASAAFTSDVQSTWAGVWFNWSGFGKFWTQLVRQTMRREAPPAASLAATFSPGVMHVTLDDATGSQAASVEGPILATELGGKSSETPMTQIAPGRFAADVPIAANVAAGEVYRFSVQMGSKDRPLGVVETFAGVPYAEEFRIKPTNVALLKQIADVSGGKFDPKPEEVFEAGETSVPVKSDLTPWLMIVSAVIFILDLMRKRL